MAELRTDSEDYRPIHDVKFSASSGNQLEYNGSRVQMTQIKLHKLNFESVESVSSAG